MALSAEATSAAEREVPAADSVVAEVSSVHLVSWNVASWKSTMDNIRRFKGGLSGFLQRHHIDVLCLQEVKVTAKAVKEDAVKLGASLPGYETFWACNEGSGGQRQGLNGVATFARQGLVRCADAAPLGSPEFDSEGRCLMTDCGDFVVFNVYVPNSSGGSRLPFKMRWLNALRTAMRKSRAAGKAVLLAGDLNMKHRPVDSHWSFRPVRVSRLEELRTREDSLVGESPEVREAVDAICSHWPDMCDALRAKEVRPIETRNSRTNQTYQRWGVFAKATSGEVVRVGSPIDGEDYARASYLVDGIGVDDDGTILVGAAFLDAPHQLQMPGEMCVSDLAECLKRLANVEIPMSALKRIADTLGRPTVAPAVRAWLQDGLLGEDGMVDSFTEFHPNAEERFTCWEQYKNRRYENVGSRIDYILVDRSFFQRFAQRGSDLYTRRGAQPDSAAGALQAATLGGLSQPSPFGGGGMPTLEEDEYYAHFHDSPSTGMIYTPPQLSDHIAVSLHLGGLPKVGEASRLSQNGATQKCQPHRSGKRITDFFGPRKVAMADAPPVKKRALDGTR